MPMREIAALTCLVGLGLAGCAPQAATGPSALPGYAADYAGKAAECETTPVDVTDGKDFTSVMITSGGGWCGVQITRQHTALGAALLVEPARSGEVYVHSIGPDITRVDYTPRGRVTEDRFAVRLIPGDEIMHVTVTPSAHPAAAPVAAPVPAAAAPAAAPARTAAPARAATRTPAK